MKMPPLLRTIMITARPTVGSEDSLLILMANETDRRIAAKEENLAAIRQVIERNIGKLVNVKVGLLPEEPSQAKRVTDISKLFAGLPVTVIK